MIFITLLLCLSLERFLHRANFLARFNWFDQYVNKVYALVKDKIGMHAYFIPLLLVVLPITIAAGVIYFLSTLFIHGLLAFLIGAFILFYCLGPLNIYDSKEIHQPIFWQANETLLAVIFWFALLGPIAALVYRLVERATHSHSTYPVLTKEAEKILAILDWLPVRLFSILFALAGNFVQTSQFWLDNLLSDVNFNRDLIQKSGCIALGLSEEANLTAENDPQALRLLDRSLLLFLIIVFAVTLGMLL